MRASGARLSDLVGNGAGLDEGLSRPLLVARIFDAQDAFDIDAPLSDLIYPDAYNVLTQNVHSGHYVGLHLVRGIQCHHLVFIQDDIDWQIWIENSQTPLPRKMVITSKWLRPPVYGVDILLEDIRTPAPGSVCIYTAGNRTEGGNSPSRRGKVRCEIIQEIYHEP